MIISHKYRFIFIKTYKTAGTSIEVFLSKICGENDILTPISPPVSSHIPRNYKGIFMPIGEILYCNNTLNNQLRTFKDFLKGRKFYNHISACKIKYRISKYIWNNYFKFAVERNPWDKTVSMFFMLKNRGIINNNFDDYLKSRELLPINYPLYMSKNNEVLVDEIIYYEDLENGLRKVFSYLNIPFKGLNIYAKGDTRPKNKNYRLFFEKEWKRKIIKEVFGVEIALHNYSF